jgi:serine/threonine-protein kinase
VALHTGARVGPYEVVSRLGAGGMGEVWKARDTRLHRDVAIKILPDDVASNPDRRRRFEQEAQLVAALNHPHVCQIHDVGPGYLVLEFIEGAPLCGPIDASEALRLGRQVASALEAAHARGVLHRDLKPSNVMVTSHGTAKLLDFGIGKLMTSDQEMTRTVDAAVIGTAAYMSPEQARGQPADVRSDIFSFGALLYEVIAGNRAFRGDTTAEALSAVLRDQPTALPPSPLARVVHRCLEKDPARRL